jgi:hypothetical protein
MSPKASITSLCAVTMAIAFSVLSADARQKERQPVGQWPDAAYASAPRQVGSGGVPSFDGRYTGRPRTCGFDTFRYSGRTTVGPYCH